VHYGGTYNNGLAAQVVLIIAHHLIPWRLKVSLQVMLQVFQFWLCTGCVSV